MVGGIAVCIDWIAWRYNTAKAGWAATLGRQAVSWGNGMVYAPMDLFNPFAPTVVDQDHKAGDDLILVERLFSSGNDAHGLSSPLSTIEW